MFALRLLTWAVSPSLLCTLKQSSSDDDEEEKKEGEQPTPHALAMSLADDPFAKKNPLQLVSAIHMLG